MDNLTTFFATNKKAFMGFAIAIGLPSTLLYCAEIWTILWHKPFHNSFYTLFVVRASSALVYTFLSYFFVRVPILFPEWFATLTLPYWAMSMYTCISGYAFVSDNLTMAFILANRFTAIAQPITHDNIWRKFMFPALLIVYGLPLYNIGTFWVNVEAVAVRDDQGKIISIDFVEVNNSTTLNTYIGITMIFSLLFLTICIPINVAIWWVYRKRRNPHQAPRVGPQLQNTIGLQPYVGNAAAKAKADRIERRLLFFAIITFFGHVLIALYLLGVYLSLTAGNVFFVNLLISQNSLVLDFGLVVLPSWLLLWASASFRKQLLAAFLPNVLYGRIYNTHSVTIIKPQTAAIVPAPKLMQISSISTRHY